MRTFLRHPSLAACIVFAMVLSVNTSLAASSASASEPVPPPAFAKDVPKVETGPPILEFNGKDLTGFTKYTREHKRNDPKNVFTVQDGLLRISGEDWGGVTTAKEYGDYHLLVEWKWGDKTFKPREKASKDSGILLHCVGPEGAAGGAWMESIECQIIEGGCGDFILVGGVGKPSLTVTATKGPDNQMYYDPAGPAKEYTGGRINWWGRDPAWKDVIGYRGPRDVEKPTGEWNVMEVICSGDTITNIVNGYVVNAGTRCNQTRGKILIQSEGAEMFVKRIVIKPLIKK